MSFTDFLQGEDPENYFDRYTKICGSLDKLPKELKSCNCCDEHRLNFPTLGWPLTNFNKDKKIVQKDCKCPCRHIARHICREWDLINEVEDLDASSCDDDYEDSGESDDSSGSLKDFIVQDDGINKKDRKELNKVLKKIRGTRS